MGTVDDVKAERVSGGFASWRHGDGGTVALDVPESEL